MIAKRLFDVVASAVAIVVLSPILLVVAASVKLGSTGPVLYRQVRIGRGRQPFVLLKFRSMSVAQPGDAPVVTRSGDPRINRVGRFIRRAKLDEIPQLFNVLRGEMSLVGPRPEVPKYVQDYPVEIAEVVLSVRPGITDPASIKFRHEEEILAAAVDPETAYREVILPAKLQIAKEYVESRSFACDLRVIFSTVRCLFDRPPHG